MFDLYLFSLILKAHPLYRRHRDEIHFLYFQLGLEKSLSAANVELILKRRLPELSEAVADATLILKKRRPDQEKLEKEGVKFLSLGEPDYPRSFYAMEDPPLCFSYLGCPVWKSHPCLSVVGSREPSFESLQWMEKEVGHFLTTQPLAIVSGGARGVDQKAHSLSLRSHRPTCVVLPSGLGCFYPANLKDWKQDIVQGGGCFISEYAHEIPMQKYLFHHRNRLIAALGVSTLIIEARHRSGTLITAEQACQMGRPVWVLPGHPQDPHFSGSLQLLMEGATMIRHAADLQALFTAEALSFDKRLAGIESYGSFSPTGSVSVNI